MYSGRLLHALSKAYNMHLMQGQRGYFDRLAEYYLKHDFPPAFTAQNPPAIPDDLIQNARQDNDETIINKLIDSLLDEYSIDSSFNLPDDAENYALNIYYFPKNELLTLLASLKDIKYSKGNNMIKSQLTNSFKLPEIKDKNRSHLSSVVVNGSDKLLQDFPFEKNVFVMMKFPDKDKPSSTDQLLEEIWDTINSTLHKSYGLRAIRADQKDYSNGGWIWDNVCIYMESSNYGVAILENISSVEFNPNVAMEFGYMKGLGRSVLLLKEKSFMNIRADIIGRIWKEFTALDNSSIRNTVSTAIHNWAIDIGLKRLAI